MTHESDILPRVFKVQPWTKWRICFLKTDLLWTYSIPRVNTVSLSLWLSSNVFDPPPPPNIVPSSPLNLPLPLNEVGPVPLISLITVERLFMFDLIALDVYEFAFDLPSQKGASPSGCVFIGLACLKGERGCLQKSKLDKKCDSTATDSQQEREYLISHWFLFKKSGCLKLLRDKFVRWNEMLLIPVDLTIRFLLNLAPRLESDVEHIFTLSSLEIWLLLLTSSVHPKTFSHRTTCFFSVQDCSSTCHHDLL